MNVYEQVLEAALELAKRDHTVALEILNESDSTVTVSINRKKENYLVRESYEYEVLLSANYPYCTTKGERAEREERHEYWTGILTSLNAAIQKAIEATE